MNTVVAGNWKMNHGIEATRRFFADFDPPEGAEILLFPPSISLSAALEADGSGSRWRIGAQSIHYAEDGAYTGEISAAMVAAAGLDHVLVGHSERRQLFGETDEDVARKVEAALAHGLVPVVCLGETLDERDAGQLEEVILRQLDAALPALGGSSTRFMIAYEPVWAIGTGRTATPEDAAGAHAILRGRLAAALEPRRAADVPLLYGGSVKPGNAEELMAAPDVDGVLVGGASLDPDSFAAIVEAGIR